MIIINTTDNGVVVQNLDIEVLGGKRSRKIGFENRWTTWVVPALSISLYFLHFLSLL